MVRSSSCATEWTARSKVPVSSTAVAPAVDIAPPLVPAFDVAAPRGVGAELESMASLRLIPYPEY